MFRDWLKLRATTPLLRLRSADEVRRRLTFENTGPSQDPALIVGHLDGRDLPVRRASCCISSTRPRRPGRCKLPAEAGKRYVLHPVLRHGRDARVRQARYDTQGRFSVPARTAAVFVIE